MQDEQEISPEELKKQVKILIKENRFVEKKLLVSEENLQVAKHQIQVSEKQIQASAEQIQASAEQIKYLQFQLDQMKRMLFGVKRERFISNITVDQLSLPFDVDQTQTLEKTAEIEQIAYTREKAKRASHPGRLDFPAHIPIEEIIIEPEQSTEGLKCIGQEITKELDYIPSKLIARHYIRPKYALPNGEGIIIGKLPTRPIEKGIAGAGLLSNILVEKFVDHLPIYRQIERFKREDIKLPASTIDSWITQTADLVEPLYDQLKKLILGQGYIQADETPIKVLDRDKKGKTHQGYHWVYNAPLQNAVFYDYQQGRGREGPLKLLENFKGYLQTDGYSVYDWFAKQAGITHVGCMAHARRYFEKALDYDAEKAGFVLKKTQAIYAIERKAREENISAVQRKELRLNETLPLMNELGKLIALMQKTAIPKSPMGIALEYTSKRWDILSNFMYDGSLEIDNNWVENAIRPNALGRKNYLFAGSHEGAKRAAMFYSFFGTCKKNNVNPYQWLKKVLEVIPDYPSNKLTDLLPQNLLLSPEKL
ncbi:MAG: IS66 family transposase [Candidatus Curtissbacteria bacterium]|nr:IS66 family transposase [Candidatus Curtissbacteria bacterium]